MTPKVLPTVLLVPGACTTPACYDNLLPYLKQASYPVVSASLASSNPANPNECTAAADGKHLLDQYLLRLVDDGKEVIVFAHSFGATSLSGAGRNLSKAERIRNGSTGGVVGLVYMSFATAPEGQSQLEFLGGAWPPFIRLNHVSTTHSDIFRRYSQGI